MLKTDIRCLPAAALFHSLARAGTITIVNPGFETATLPYNAGNGAHNQSIAGSTINPPVTGGTLAGWTARSNTGTNSRTYTEAFFDSVARDAEAAATTTPEPRTFALLPLGAAAVTLVRGNRRTS